MSILQFFLISPLSVGVRTLSNVFTDSMAALKLFLNRRNKFSADIPFYVPGTKLEIITTFNYQGCILKWDLVDFDDILKCPSAFNRIFEFLYRKLYYVNIKILYSFFFFFFTFVRLPWS